MSDPTIVGRDVTFQVRDARLVSNTSVDLVPGELVAVIGPNGAGKSTLLNLLSGNLLPTTGQVFVNGIDTAVALPGELALERAILTQREPIDIPYSAAQIVGMGRFPRRGDEANTSASDQAAVADAMTQTDTTRFAKRSYSTLSKGEQSRVSLARVIAQATPVILLDEPTAALDVAHQERIMKRIVDLTRNGKTIVVVLHDLNSAAVYAKRIILMDVGKIVADGPPADVLQADRLSTVYNQEMVVVDHPFRDCPLVLTAE